MSLGPRGPNQSKGVCHEDHYCRRRQGGPGSDAAAAARRPRGHHCGFQSRRAAGQHVPIRRAGSAGKRRHHGGAAAGAGAKSRPAHRRHQRRRDQPAVLPDGQKDEQPPAHHRPGAQPGLHRTALLHAGGAGPFHDHQPGAFGGAGNFPSAAVPQLPPPGQLCQGPGGDRGPAGGRGQPPGGRGAAPALQNCPGKGAGVRGAARRRGHHSRRQL